MQEYLSQDGFNPGDPRLPIKDKRILSYIASVTRHLPSGEDLNHAQSELFAQLTRPEFQDPNIDFSYVSNEVGVHMENSGILGVALQCYEWSFQESESFRNFHTLALYAYGGNFVRLIDKISQKPGLDEVSKDFLRSKKDTLEGIGSFFTLRKNYLIYERAFNQLGQSGGIEWNGDADQQQIVESQNIEQTAMKLANLL